jgi:hypothetical protein
MKRLLNVGGGSRQIPLPPEYAGYEQVLLDIDPLGEPDIVLDGRALKTLAGDQFDAVYCSHNLEHYYRHDVPRVLEGFLHVLKRGGFAQIKVPDMAALMQAVVSQSLELDDVLYPSAAGPITPLDVMYGLGRQIESSGVDFYAHRTGFTLKTLNKAVVQAGFEYNFCQLGNLEINLLAFKGVPDTEALARFGLGPA